jgi:hypothetical protein
LLVATGLCTLMQLYAVIPLVGPVAADLGTCFSLSYAAASALAPEGTWR